MVEMNPELHVQRLFLIALLVKTELLVRLLSPNTRMVVCRNRHRFRDWSLSASVAGQ